MVHRLDKGYGTHLDSIGELYAIREIEMTYQAGKVVPSLTLQFLWTSKSLDIFDIGEKMVGVRSYDYEDKDWYKCISSFVLLEMTDET